MIDFEWNPNKASRNLSKHGVSFEEAATVFDGDLAATIDDPDHSDDEERYLTIGYTQDGRLLIVSHTDRGDRTRIISAREVTRHEQQVYERGDWR